MQRQTKQDVHQQGFTTEQHRHYHSYHTLPHATTHYHTLPHATTRYHTLPHATTRYHTLPHTTTRYHTLCIKHIKNVISVTFIPSHLPIIQPPKASPISFLCDEYKSLPMPTSTVLMSGYFSLHWRHPLASEGCPMIQMESFWWIIIKTGPFYLR